MVARKRSTNAFQTSRPSTYGWLPCMVDPFGWFFGRHRVHALLAFAFILRLVTENLFEIVLRVLEAEKRCFGAAPQGRAAGHPRVSSSCGMPPPVALCARMRMRPELTDSSQNDPNFEETPQVDVGVHICAHHRNFVFILKP